MNKNKHDGSAGSVVENNGNDGAVVLDSRNLFLHSRTVYIEHESQRYMLRLTKDNKLILTK
jgi:hemin uptake protein HemP